MRTQAGEISINYESDGEGTPLVLTHGLGDDLHFWDHLVPMLAQHHRVLRWDVRGFGESDKPAGPYSPSMLSDDLAALLDASGVAAAHVAGLSMGGVIAQRLTLDHSQRVLSLVLASTSSEVGPRASEAWRRLADQIEQGGFGPGTSNPSRSFSSGFAASQPEVVAAAGARVANNDPRAHAAAARAMSDYNWTADLTRVRVPVLILQGLADRLTPPGGAVKMQRALPAARLLMIPEAGHYLPLEQPGVFSAALLGFTGALDATARLAGDLPAAACR